MTDQGPLNNPRQILKLIGVGFGLAALVVVAVGFLLPREYAVQRQTVIAAPPDQVHQWAGDLERWPAWVSWLQSEDTVITSTGPTTGPGATLSWQNDTGGGEIVLSRSQVDWGVAFDLTLGKSRRLSACSLLYREIQQGTEVTWTMQGDSGLDIFDRYFNLLLDPLMGPMLADGLDNLRLQVEGPGAGDAQPDKDGDP